MHDVMGTTIADFPTVVKTAMRELGVIGSFQVSTALLLRDAMIQSRRAMDIQLIRVALSSHHHHQALRFHVIRGRGGLGPIDRRRGCGWRDLPCLSSSLVCCLAGLSRLLLVLEPRADSTKSSSGTRVIGCSSTGTQSKFRESCEPISEVC